MKFIDTLQCYLEYPYMAPLKLLRVKTKIHWHVRGFKDINVFSTYLRHMIHATFIRRGLCCVWSEEVSCIFFYQLILLCFASLLVSILYVLPLFLSFLFTASNLRDTQLFYTLFFLLFSQFYLFKFNIWSYPLFSFVNVIR